MLKFWNETEISKKDLRPFEKIGNLKINEDGFEVNFKANETSIKKVIKTLYQSNLNILDLSTKDITLEDIFINLTSNKQS